jgi:hypothetical protein
LLADEKGLGKQYRLVGIELRGLLAVSNVLANNRSIINVKRVSVIGLTALTAC